MNKPCPPSATIGDYLWKETYLAAVSTGAQIVAADVNRVALLVWVAPTGGAPLISTSSTAPSDQGLPISQSPNRATTLYYRDVGPLVGAAWYVVLTGGTANVTVFTLTYSPIGG